MTESKELFRSRFRALLEERGWSQNTFAGISGVAQSLIGKYLSGDVAPSLENLDRIAAAFKIHPTQFISASSEAAAIASGLELAALRWEVVEALSTLKKDQLGLLLKSARAFKAGEVLPGHAKSGKRSG